MTETTLNIDVQPIDIKAHWQAHKEHYPYICGRYQVDIWAIARDFYSNSNLRRDISVSLGTLDDFFYALFSGNSDALFLSVDDANRYPSHCKAEYYFLSISNADYLILCRDVEDSRIEKGYRVFQNVISVTHYILSTLVHHLINGTVSTLFENCNTLYAETFIQLDEEGQLIHQNFRRRPTRLLYTDLRDDIFIRSTVFPETAREKKMFINDVYQIYLPNVLRLFPGIDELSPATKRFLLSLGKTQEYQLLSQVMHEQCDWVNRLVQNFQTYIKVRNDQ